MLCCACGIAERRLRDAAGTRKGRGSMAFERSGMKNITPRTFGEAEHACTYVCVRVLTVLNVGV